MNIFYNNVNNIWTLVMPCPQNIEVTAKHKKQCVLYFNKAKKIVGFNIFLKTPLEKIQPGRLITTKPLIKLLHTYSLEIEVNSNIEFVVGQIISCEHIENTHLSKCIVDIKTQKLNIVCGASNAKVGLKTVVACVGTIFANGLEIKPTKLQNFESHGMLCSQKELNLTGYNEQGIIELDNEFPRGSTFLAAYASINR